MATLIQLAQAIESDYAGDTAGSVKVCRPDMNQPISASNLPFFHESGSNQENTDTGIKPGSMKVRAQTTVSGDVTIVDVQCIADTNADSCTLTVDGRNALENYKKYFRPYDSENDNLWTHVLNYFKNTRGLVVVSKIDIFVGTPVYGHVHGTRLIGDGVDTFESKDENWLFEARYPWGTEGNIKSWNY